MEESHSGLVRHGANVLFGLNRTVGSNPTSSAANPPRADDRGRRANQLLGLRVGIRSSERWVSLSEAKGEPSESGLNRNFRQEIYC